MSTKTKDKRIDLAWQVDLASSYGKLPGGFRFSPVLPAGHENFLSSMDHGPLIVSAARGMGKSIFLYFRAKTMNQFKRVESLRNAPPFGYPLTANNIPIPEQNWEQYSNATQWMSIWRLALGLSFAGKSILLNKNISTDSTSEEWLSAFGIDNSDKDTLIARLINQVRIMLKSPHVDGMTRLITYIIDSKYFPKEINELYDSYVYEILAEDNSDKYDRLFTYIDSLDEAIVFVKEGENIAFNNTYDKSDDNARSILMNIWMTSQAGLALAAYLLKEEFTSRFFALVSIRSESLSTFLDVSTKGPKIRKSGDLFEISYSESDLKRIFCYNVSLMSPSQTIGEQSYEYVESKNFDDESLRNATLALTGYSELRNKVVIGPSESIYSLIRRHSFGTPRNIARLGGIIADVERTKSPIVGETGLIRDPSSIYQRINGDHDVWDEFTTTSFPPWDERLERGFPFIKSNILTPEDCIQIDQQFNAIETTRDGELVRPLYERGLIGTPLDTDDQTSIQHFKYAWNDDVPWKADHRFLLVHSNLAARIWSFHSGQADAESFYDPRLLVNPGEVFPKRLSLPIIRIKIPHRKLGYPASIEMNGEELGIEKKHPLPTRVLMSIFFAMRLTNSDSVLEEDVHEASRILYQTKLFDNLISLDRLKHTLERLMANAGKHDSAQISRQNGLTLHRPEPQDDKQPRSLHIENSDGSRLTTNDIIFPNMDAAGYLIVR